MHQKNLSDTALALDLAISLKKINTHLKQKEKAMKKIRELLFTELCQFLSLKNEEVNKKWRKMKDEEVMKEVNKKVSFSNLLGPPRLRFMQMIKPSKKK